MNGTLQLSLPEALDISEFELKMIVASKLYEMGRLSAGQAAEVAGVTKRTFIELLGKFGVSVFGYDANEVVDELERL